MNIYKAALHPDYITQLYRAYKDHRGRAKKRDIEFKFTFDQWLDLWLASGHLHERGCKRGQYVMARYDDLGAYEASNVRIILHADNLREGNNSRAARSATAKAAHARPEVKEKHKETNARPEVKAKRSASLKEAMNSPEVKAKLSAAAKAAQNRPEVKAKIKAAINRPEVKAKIKAKRQIKIKTPAGIFPSRTDAAKHYGVSLETILKWIRSDPNRFSQIKNKEII